MPTLIGMASTAAQVPGVRRAPWVGLGVALVPQSLRCIQLPGIRFRSLRGMTVTSELAAAFRRNDPSPAIRAITQQIRRLGEAWRASSHK